MAMAMDKEARTVLCRPIHLSMHGTPSCKCLLLTREHCYMVCLYIRVPLACGKYLYVHSAMRA